MKLEGRVALVTGASSGIGRGVALAFAREGAAVAVNYPDAAEAVRAEAVRAEAAGFGREAITLRGDVSEPAEVDRLVGECERAFGRVDILVNNAGIAAAAPVESMPIEQWDRVLAVHLRGTFLMTRRVLPGMYERGFGRIINTASQLAYKGAAGFSHYTAAKGAILSFSRSLALEVGSRGITVNCVAPGATKTPMLDDVPADLLEQIRLGIPLGRLAEVSDIVPAYVLLASEEGRHFHGQCLSPNGGDVFL